MKNKSIALSAALAFAITATPAFAADRAAAPGRLPDRSAAPRVEPPPKGTSARQSSDGVDYPDAPDERKIKVELPLIGAILGGLPEETGKRVVHTDKSRAQFERMKQDVPPGQWVIIRPIPEAQLMTLTLDRGRIKSVVLTMDQVGAPVFERVLKRAELDPSTTETTIEKDGVTVNVTARRYAHDKMGVYSGPAAGEGRANSMTLTFALSDLDWYLAYTDVAAEIAAAMREGRPIEGMTLEQATLALGKPAQISTAGETQIVNWKFGTVTMGRTSLTGSVKTPSRITTDRWITAHFTGGKLVRFTDNKL